MSEDLAIDVGLAVNTDEYDVFVATVDNILEMGCQYNQDVTNDIVDKCASSELAIARRVIDACQKKTGRYRSRKLKWWQTYRRRDGRDRHDDRRDRRPYNPKGSLGNASKQAPKMKLFENTRREDRERKRTRNRVRAPPRTPQRQERRRHVVPNRRRRSPDRRRRPMSPMFREKSPRDREYDRETDVPRWPTNNKRRRYR